MVRRPSYALEMLAQHLTQTTELGLSLMLQTKVQRLVSNLLIGHLKTCVVLENIQCSAISLPQELEPRCDERAISTVTILILRNTSKKNALWCFTFFKVVHVKFFCCSICTTASLCYLRVRMLQEMTRHVANGLRVRVLKCILVLHKCIFRSTSTALIDTELHESIHQGLHRRRWTLFKTPREREFLQCLQGRRCLTNIYQLFRTF